MTAPGGASLQLIVEPNWVPANGGAADVTLLGFRSSGAPLPDGTVIQFFTDLGKIVPDRVETKDGRAQVVFVSDQRSGTATIRAVSGRDAQAEAQIQVGATAASTIEMGAFPAVLPLGGGTTRIVVRVLNSDGNPIRGVAIFLASSAGSLQSNGSILITNENGKVEDKLTTEEPQTTVTASAGTLTASITISVGENNQYPTPVFDYSPTNPCIGQNVFFNAWQSTDTDGFITSYRWDFGDGDKGSGVTIQHKYKTSGQYTVVLRVTDDDGYVSATSRTVTVTATCGDAPIAIITGPTDSPSNGGDGDGFLEVNEILTFDGSGSFDPDGGAITNYSWDFGDSATGSGAVTTHAYSAAQTYTVTLTVTDDEGVSASITKTVTIVTNR